MRDNNLQKVLNGALAAVLAVHLFAVIILASVPPVSRDALTHHLAVPKLYLNHGGIYEIEDIPFSYYPMNLDLLYLIPLYFHNDIVPKYIHFAFALATAVLIARYLRRRLGTPYALFGAVFFLTIPVILKLSITVYVDLGLVFFSFAALLSLFKWGASGLKHRYLILAGVCCGLALGTKYNGLITCFLLTLIVPVIYVRSRQENRRQLGALMPAAVFLTAAVIAFSPWLIRNAWWTGNPIYPLFDNWFNPPATVASTADAPAAAAPAISWTHFNVRRHVYGDSLLEIGLTPVRIFFQGQDGDPKYFDGRLNPGLLVLSLLAFLSVKRDPPRVRLEKILLAGFAALFILIVFFQDDMRIRWISPVVPPLVLLAVYGVKTMVAGIAGATWPPPARAAGRLAIAAVLALVVAWNAAYAVHQFQVVRPGDYLSGKLDRDAYISRHRPEYDVIVYANETLSADSKIFGLFLGKRQYYSDREMVFDLDWFNRSVKNADSVASLLSAFRRRGISHIAVGHRLFKVWADGKFDAREKRLMAVFFETAAVELQTARGYSLYRIDYPKGGNTE